MFKLFRSKGCGSTVVEAMLELLELPYESVTIDWDSPADWEAVKKVNPLGQVPTLITPEGAVMTESAAIVFALLDRQPDSPLAPPRGTKERDLMFRWTSFLATNVYGAIIIGDAPERFLPPEGRDESVQAHVKAGTKQRAQQCWQMMEAQIEPGPYLLGARMSALDVYAAMVSRWRPGRAWIEAHCPKIAAAVKKTEAQPVVARVWARNFG